MTSSAPPRAERRQTRYHKAAPAEEWDLLILYILYSEAASCEQVQTVRLTFFPESISGTAFLSRRNVDVGFTMAKTVYWTITTPCTIQVGGQPVQVRFLRFGVATGTMEELLPFRTDDSWSNPK